MKILSIETSGSLCGVGLSNEGKLTSQYTADGTNDHDRLCAEFIRRILEDNNISVKQLDAIAISSGPGSFTGLRIGASLAKALCFIENKEDYAPKLIAVPTLSAFAFAASKIINKSKYDRIISAIPAQKGVVYYQEFRINAEPLGNIVITEKIDLMSFIEAEDFLCGTFANELKLKDGIDYLNNYSVAFISELADKLYIAGKFENPKTYTPAYIQEFNVKTKRKELDI